MKAISSLVAASSMLLSSPTELNVGVQGLTLTKQEDLLAEYSHRSDYVAPVVVPKEHRIPKSMAQIERFIEQLHVYMHHPQPQLLKNDYLHNSLEATEYIVNNNGSARGQKVGFRIFPQRIAVYYQESNEAGDWFKSSDEILAKDVTSIKWERGERVESDIFVATYMHTVTFQKDFNGDVIKFEANLRQKELLDKIFRFWAGLEQPVDETFPDYREKHLYSAHFRISGCEVDGNWQSSSPQYEHDDTLDAVQFMIPTKDNLILFHGNRTTNHYLGEILAEDVVNISWEESGDSKCNVSFLTKDDKVTVLQLNKSSKEKSDEIFRFWAGLDRVARNPMFASPQYSSAQL